MGGHEVASMHVVTDRGWSDPWIALERNNPQTARWTTLVIRKFSLSPDMPSLSTRGDLLRVMALADALDRTPADLLNLTDIGDG